MADDFQREPFRSVAGSYLRASGADTGRHLRSVGSATAAGLAGAAGDLTSGNWTAGTLLWGVVAISMLYLLLSNPGLPEKAIKLVTGSLAWLIKPSVLPL